MIYTVITNWDDQGNDLRLATYDFESAKELVQRLAHNHDGDDFQIRVGAWLNGKESTYGYGCCSRTSWLEYGNENFDVEDFLETLADNMKRESEIQDTKNEIENLRKQLAAAEEKLRSL